jgi:hypothetical protein
VLQKTKKEQWNTSHTLQCTISDIRFAVFHILEEASNLKWKTTCIYERFTLLVAFFTYRKKASDLNWQNLKYRIFTYRKKLQM